ncbi:SdrD B-like domain-containing protein [Methylobacter tundripaludum]|uniref:Uncharacterized protein n=1 Tax=Methylobacter tundripaludum (strain ATCC BAA-1195 / DSM 17260 / SV96) TaxID=697282 RepID=G3IXE0_METTV|nr:SdrD B-like domain-containing protein [Methylobacter tundripaludum]EGW23197.1 hypothetical protein Mettu_2040 [Methylobacter tundripaludum SV96]
MNKKKSKTHVHLLSSRGIVQTILSLGLLVSAFGTTQVYALSLTVQSRDGNTTIADYKYIINVDNTGTTEQLSPAGGCSPADPAYPGTVSDPNRPCNWVSIAGVPGSSPIYTQGDQNDIADVNLTNGKYLISVLADGYKLDGVHVTAPVSNVTVQLQPNGALPSATIQAAVFEDISPTNGAPDVPAERGLAGFVGHITDYIDEVTTDVNGDPLCGGQCVSQCYVVVNGVDVGTVAPVDAVGHCPTTDASGNTVEGKLKIPNLGPNRYALSITPPNGSNWQQTTTLEGNLDWDSWVMEGATGLDTEFVVAGEPFPAAIFGYVQSKNTLSGGGGSISGFIDAVKVYVPTTGGVGGLPGTIWGGLAGAKIDGPVKNPWIALTDLTNGDTAVWIGQGDANGHFSIPGVPEGNYTLTWWDSNLNYILDLVQLSVGPNESVDMGVLPLTGWWSKFEGYVYNDTNKNGKKDPGEAGLANYPVSMKKRENSLMDRGAVTVTTDANGHYVMENAYPMTQWLVMEAYDDLHYSTGITYQADNQPNETTVPGEGVDVSVLPIIGLSGHLDWGKHSYEAGTNGGIVGTVSYDTTRNETDPRFAAVEAWQPGVSNLPVKLYAPVPCGTNTGAPCDASGRYELEVNGAFKKATVSPLQTYITETWQRPSGCVARDVDGNPLVGQQVLPANPAAECLEGPLMGIQFGPMPDNPAAPTNFGAAVDGNYGFGGLSPGDYLVEVEVPNDALGRPLYKFTREEDINIANGDTFVPQIPPPECAGPLHEVDVAGYGTDNYGPLVGDGNTVPVGVTVPASTPTVNSTFVSIGGSPYEGQPKPLCNMKLVHVSNGKSVAPSFTVFTDVPIPARFWGLIVDDLNFSSDPKALNYGEKAGVPFAPVGIYDWSNKLVHTAESDFNGLFDVLLPSTNRISCPTPSGVCANLYRFVGNDPGTPGNLNLNYHPEFRTIAAEFEAIPGLIVPADLAPTQVGVTVQLPGGQVAQPLSCPLNIYTGPNATPPEKLVPELMAVSTPVVTRPSGTATVAVTIQGDNFGTKTGPANVYLDSVPVPTAAWTPTSITMQITSSAAFVGPHQLTIVSANGQKTVNGLTFHVLGGNYMPNVITVGPGINTLTNPHAIQNALDAAAVNTQTLVVVYPGVADANPRANPRGAYYENLIIHSPVKLQGIGPGGIRSDGSTVAGTIIDGSAFAGDTQQATDWRTTVANLAWVGTQTVYEGAVITVYPQTRTQFGSTFRASIDGLDLRGGDQQGFPTNINQIGGTPTGLAPNVVTQGGAIFANGYAHYLQITNNVVQNNGGAYGTVRVGTPNLQGNDANEGTDQHNDNVRIANNRIIANGGTNLAGAVGLFAGTSNYEVAGNDICGNFSAEYGGGISAYGLNYNRAASFNSTTNFGGKIHHNRIYLNRSYDEGAGIMIAGALPSNPDNLSTGAGPVAIYSNLIQGNLANDDGGGIRFLQAAADCAPAANTYTPCNSDVYNNMIVNNVSTHEGGGISLNDAPAVRVYNNTIMKNITTATAVTSTGSPAPAGLSTSLNSAQLQAALGNPVTNWSNPLLFNNIFWDNRAGARSGSTVTGIGAAGDATALNLWDLGASDTSGLLAPTNSIVQQNAGQYAYITSATNANSDPQVVTPYDTILDFAAWRTNPAFIGAILVSADLPPTLLGDYHLLAGSTAINLGAGSKNGVNAPGLDIDDGARTGLPDSGADEQGIVGSIPGGGGTPGGGGGGTPTLPALAVLDNFNRANANTLGGNWSQIVLFGNAAIRVNSSQAVDLLLPGAAYWNGIGNNFGANQAAAFTFANTTLNNAALVLKASGGSASIPANFIRVQYQTASGGRIVVQTTTNSGGSYNTRATFTAGANFANGNTLSAVARANGTVEVYKTAGTTTTLVGSVIIPMTGSGAWTQGASGGRIGMQLPSSARVDNFSGGMVP